MWYWLHHLITPHCIHCQQEAEEQRVCRSCESLKEQIAFERAERQQLLNQIMSLTQRPVETAAPMQNPQELPKAITWRVRKHMLEAEDRAAAELLRKKQREDPEIAKLEKELGVEDAEAVGGST